MVSSAPSNWGKNEFVAKWYSVPGEKVSNSGPLFFSQVSNWCPVSDQRGVQSSRWPLHYTRLTYLHLVTFLNRIYWHATTTQ
jgi:hypothetical protein